MASLFLEFPGEDPDFYTQLSAIAFAGDRMWVGADEGTGVVSLQNTGGPDRWRAGPPHSLAGLLDLPGQDSEIDLEGMDYDTGQGCLWLVGSHSLKRKKPVKNPGSPPKLKSLATVAPDANRYLLARVPLDLGPEPGDLLEPAAFTETRYSAQLECDAPPFRSALSDALSQDPYFARFLQSLRVQEDDDPVDLLGIPGKDNGLDIEGLAVAGLTATGATRLFIGLRGPVLRGWAAILELHVLATPPAEGRHAGGLELQTAGEEGRPHRRIFLQLDGLGIRDLCFQGDDLLILAGPTMALDWPVTIYRWSGARNPWPADQILDQTPGLLDALFTGGGTGANGEFERGNRAEAMALWPHAPEPCVAILYDAPGPSRLASGADQVLGDLLPLPAP